MAIDIRKRDIANIKIPYYISDNLAFELREYQKEAIARFLYYNNNTIYDANDNEMSKSPHLLWQMATGSGKTLIMAALILEMYQKGYRNFWFFVTSTDIITKTIDNFTNSSARKYQFAQKIEIDGRQIEIRQVENFAITNPDAINIKFSTINILHQISQPEMFSENSVTLEDFAETPLCLIGDEAHHLNAATKKEKEDENSWENSVQKLLNANPKNMLFEFTATANLTNDAIAKKYDNKLIYNYDLRHFRDDKYSKDVFTFSTDAADMNQIMLRAILVSQYRKHIASDNGIALKPVVLFKSKGVSDSKENFEKFNSFIGSLTETVLKNELQKPHTDTGIWNKTANYFSGKEKNLVEELKMDFAVDAKKVLLHDGTNKRIAEQPQLLATLEDGNNPVRAIFAVNMLQEGWDVLNLFDIVRLYETRDGGTDRNGNYKPGAGTISEAQLIGRGARYYPFLYKNTDKYKRKFDDNEAELLRVIEQMHYHCKYDSRYISEIRQTLIESGIIAQPDLFTEYNLEMKDDYKSVNSLFGQKNIYENAILPKKDWTDSNIEIVENELIEQEICTIPNFRNDEVMIIRLSSGKTQENAVFDRENESATAPINSPAQPQRTVAELIPNNILRFALNSNKNFSFDKLQLAYPELKSMSQFMDLLGKKQILISGAWQNENPQPFEILHIAQYILKNIEIGIKTEQKKVYVTKEFKPLSVCEKFESYITRKVGKTDSETGKSQKDSENYALDLSKYDWYVYNDNFGTSEEKSFVKWFADFEPTLKENGWTDIYLVRNEKAVKLYSWYKANLGEGFEPDFVLLMKKGNIEYVFYIEPKGDWTYDAANKNFGREQWKEDFLLEIEAVVSKQQAKMTNNKNWRLVGLPFYNEEHTKKSFDDKIKTYI
jgi:type III restriction enzyme